MFDKCYCLLDTLLQKPRTLCIHVAVQYQSYFIKPVLKIYHGQFGVSPPHTYVSKVVIFSVVCTKVYNEVQQVPYLLFFTFINNSVLISPPECHSPIHMTIQIAISQYVFSNYFNVLCPVTSQF